MVAGISYNNQENPRASAWLTVDLGALANNYNIFREQAPPGCVVSGVIKADGYGLGVDKVFAALENQACPFYFVATLEEALHLRKLTEKPVAVFGGLYKGAENDYVHESLLPVLNSLEEIARWRSVAENHDIPLQALVHFDTGMNRLGLGQDETGILQEEPDRLDGLDIRYALSHFVAADEQGNPVTREQYERFLKATAPFPHIKKCLANSSGIMRSADYHFDMVRPGISLYGGNPTPETQNPMNAVVNLQVRILQVRNVSAGETVGYGQTHRFEKETKLATVALGYADGFLRYLGNRGHLYYKGAACPITGRVSMDAVTLDVGHINPAPQPGETVEVIGPHQDIDTLANAAGTISYEILTDLGRRYHRIYIS